MGAIFQDCEFYGLMRILTNFPSGKRRIFETCTIISPHGASLVPDLFVFGGGIRADVTEGLLHVFVETSVVEGTHEDEGILSSILEPEEGGIE